jgi:hypothetical protein
MNTELRAHFLELRKQKMQRRAERILERREDEHNEQRQHKAYEATKCPRCHKTIREKGMRIATEVFMYTGEYAQYHCQCPRPALAEQTRRFLLTYRYGNCSPITVSGTQYPNGSVTLGVRMPTNADERNEFSQVFESMRVFKAVLYNQQHIHDWTIEWVDPEPEGEVEQ